MIINPFVLKKIDTVHLTGTGAFQRHQLKTTKSLQTGLLIKIPWKYFPQTRQA